MLLNPNSAFATRERERERESPRVATIVKVSMPARMMRGRCILFAAPSTRLSIRSAPRNETNRCSRRSTSMKSRGISSLHEGTWFKLICGASSEDAPSIRNLCEIYTIAGADCIDISASKPIIRTARSGIAAAMSVTDKEDPPLPMVSINDDSDPHFRKAVFNAGDCLTDCAMPCARVCPVEAINVGGVVADVCYGCGRCLSVCPIGIIDAVEYTHEVDHIREMLKLADVVEIHTGPGHLRQFDNLWEEIGDVASQLAVVAVSFPSLGDDNALREGIEHMAQTLRNLKGEIIWQTDGRPMSGDIGRGTAYKAVKLAGRVLRVLDETRLHGHVQLAGGTNDATVGLLGQARMLREPGRVHGTASGIAVGGYARKIVREALGDEYGAEVLSPGSFRRAVQAAKALVEQVKVTRRRDLTSP